MNEGLHKTIVEAILLQRPHGVMTYSGSSAPAGSDVAVAGWGLIDVTGLADAILAAIEPLIEREGPAAPIEDFVAASISDLDRLSDRVGDLESWRASLVDGIRLQTNQTTRDLGSILRRLDAFDAKNTASINHFKDVNNAIERLERQVFGGLQPRDAEYEYPHLDAVDTATKINIMVGENEGEEDGADMSTFVRRVDVEDAINNLSLRLRRLGR